MISFFRPPTPCTLRLHRPTTSKRAGETAVELPYARVHLFNRRQSKHEGELR